MIFIVIQNHRFFHSLQKIVLPNNFLLHYSAMLWIVRSVCELYSGRLKCRWIAHIKHFTKIFLQWSVVCILSVSGFVFRGRSLHCIASYDKINLALSFHREPQRWRMINCLDHWYVIIYISWGIAALYWLLNYLELEGLWKCWRDVHSFRNDLLYIVKSFFKIVLLKNLILVLFKYWYSQLQ